MNLFERVIASVLFILISLIGNTRIINYDYDEAGNRILREIVISSRKIAESAAIVPYFTDMLAKKAIQIYPNPTKGYMKIKIVGYMDSDLCSMQIFNMDGIQLLTIVSSEQETEIDLSDYSNGMYILHICLNGEYTSWKIIKE